MKINWTVLLWVPLCNKTGMYSMMSDSNIPMGKYAVHSNNKPSHYEGCMANSCTLSILATQVVHSIVTYQLLTYDFHAVCQCYVLLLLVYCIINFVAKSHKWEKKKITTFFRYNTRGVIIYLDRYSEYFKRRFWILFTI